MPDNVDKLFEIMQAKGAASNRDKFRKVFLTPGNKGYKIRKDIYDGLRADGIIDSPTYEDFRRKLRLGGTPTVNKYRQQMFNSVDPHKSRASELTRRAVGQAVRATNNVRKPVTAKVVNQKGKPTGEEFAITPAKTVEDLDREYAQETTKNWENELHDQIADADKDAAKISDMFKSFIGSTDEVGSVWGNMTRGGGIAGTPHSVTTNNGILENTETRQILAAGDYNRKRRELLQLEQDSRNGAIFDNHSFFRGMYDAAKDTGFLTGGASDLINAGSLLATKQDLDNGIHTEAGDMLMQQAVKNSNAQSQYGDNKGWMYTGGVITTNMAPFMVQIGSAGFSKGMSNAIGKVVQGAASKVALGTMEKATGMVGAHIANYIGKVTGLTTKAFGKAIQYGIVGAAQANTVGLGNVANDVVNRYTGHVYQDEQGNYKFGTFDSDGKLVHEGGEDFLTALVKGEAAQTIEFATELAGGGIDAAGTALKNFVTKGGKKIINKYNMENVSKVIDFLLNNKVSKNARYLKAGADRTLGKVEVNSIVGESLEEELGIIANTVFTGDNKISDLWDEKQQSQIWGGMLLSIGLMKGAVAPFHAYNAKQYYSYKHKLDKADVNLSQLLGKEKWEELRNQIDATTNEDMPEMVNKINRDVALGKNRQPVREYIQNLLIMRGYDIGNMLAAKKAVEDKGEGVSVKNMEKNQAYQQGRDAYGYDTHEIQLDQEDKQKSLAQLLGISEQQLASMSDEELEALSGRDDNIDRAIYDYQLSTARYEGVIDNARDQIDLEVQRAAQAVDMYTDKSRNTIRNATIKATGGLEDYGVYIINGNIATHEDGSIDISNSDDMILYYDPTTNAVEHADAMMFAELGSEENADEVRSQAMADAKEKAIKETTGIIDGVVEVGTQFKTVDADGTEHTYEVLADNGDGTAMITIDGNIPTELVKGENVNVPVSFAELQQMKDASDQQRLQAAKAEREQMESERAAQQNEETEQTEETQPSFDFKKILNDNGNVVLADVLDEDGNTRYPNSKLFLIRDSGAKAKVVELKSDGTLKSHAVDKKDVRTANTMPLDEYKQAMAESSMIEDNSGENRGEIEVETPTIEGETAAPESAETPAASAITLEDGTIVPMLEDGNPDFSKLTAAQTAELYDSQFGEDADSIVSGYVSDAKKALDKASNMTVKGKTFVEQKAAKDEKEKAIADAQAAYNSAVAIRDAYNERQLAKVEDSAEGRKELIEKARRKFARLKSAVKDDAEAVAQIYKETVGTLLHRLYDVTGIDVTDTIPLTAEEYVASNLGAHSLNYEGTETSKGVKQETGLSREDFAKTQLLAADGKGTTIDNLVHSLWENRPSNLDSLDTQDIRNAMLSVITSGFKASEARNYIENLRIAQAENFLEEQKKAADNAAFAEENKAESEQPTETAPESEEKTGEENSDEINDKENEKINEQTNENINAPEVPEDATEENPLGLQLREDKVPFEIEGGKSGETYNINDNEDRQRLINDNKVDDKDILDIDMPKHVHKAIKELCKKMGLKVQFLYMGARSNGWIENGTMYLALDTEKATQFVFGHEMTHAIKQKNPEAYKELVKVAMAVTTKKKFEEDLANVYQNYHGISGYNNVDDYVEEVVADNLGKFINDFDLAQKFSLRLNHPVLATILHAIQKIKSLLYGDFYKSVDALERIVEKAYVDTAKGEVTNSETGEDVSFSLRQKPEPKKKGVGYKVFVLKDGKLYPPMVANPNGAATPVGVWLDADAAPIAGESKTGRPQVKQGGKGTQGGSGKLAYRPGWHLGVVPYAIQFNRKDADGNKTLFPKNFVFAEVEYAADVDYQEEARQEGINPSGKYQHSLAGLKHLPTDGYYMYRTNPNPETDPWVITGAMKVNRILTRAEQADLVSKAGREPQQIQEGDIVTDDVVNSINQEIADAPKFSLKVYHGSGADFTEFDFDHIGEGEGSQAFGWGGYVTSSEEIGEDYTRRAKIRKDNGGFEFVTDLSADNKDMVKQYIYKYKDVDKGLDAMRKDLPDALELFPDDENIKELSKVLEKKNEEIAVPDNIAYLYDVDIPDDNGSNYLKWDKKVPSKILNKVNEGLESIGKKIITPMADSYSGVINGEDLYKAIASRLTEENTIFKNDKAASKFLSSIGFTGIKYPAGTIFGGAKKGDTNYVIFKPEDMKITEHTKFSIKTYHGSQASFDHFDHSFMGSGEGAQAYGWGTYVSEVEGIAKAYAKQNTAKRNTEYTKAKNAYEIALADIDFHNNILDGFKKDIEYQKENIAQKQKMIDDISKYIENTDKDSEKYKDGIKTIEQMKKIIDRANKTIESTTSAMKDRQEMLDLSIKERDEAKAKLDFTEKPKRNLYSVDIPDDTGRNYIGWDEPLGAAKIMRLPKVFKADGWEYKKVGMYDTYKIDGNEHEVWLEPTLTTGKELYRDLTNALGSDKAASEFLSKAGFVGVKVIAQRNTGGNKEGKMNYVIFDENNAQITSHTKFSLKKDGLTPEIANTPVNIVDADEEHGFKNYAEAREWAKKNIVRTYNDEETGGKGEINISNTAVGKYLSEKAIDKSISKDVHMSVLKVLPSVLRESVDAYQHGDRKKVNNVRSEKFGINPDVMIHRCFGAVNIGGKVYGVKITLKENVKTRENKKLYSYEATKIELLDGKNEGVTMTPSLNSNNSITVAKIAKVFETAKKNGEKFSLKDEKTMFGMHNISVDKLRKAIKQGGFAAPSMGVVDSKNGIYSDYGEITLIPKAEKLAKRTGKNAGTFTADAWTPTYPQVERIMNKQGEKAFNTDMNVKLGDVDNGIYSNIRESWKGYLSSGDVRDGLYWHYLFDKGMNPETIYQTGKYDNDITNEVMRISDNGNKTDYTDKEVAELIQLMNKATGKDNDVDAQREKLKARIASAEKQGNHLLVALKKKRLEELEGVENFYIAADFVNDVVHNNRKNGKVDVHDTMDAAKENVENDKKLSDDFPSWLDKKTEEYGVEEMLYNGTTPSGKPKYIPNTIENAVKLMKKQGVAGGYTAFGSELGVFIAKNSPEVNTLAAMKNAKDKLIPFGDERHNQIKDKITKEFLELSDEIRVGSNNRYAFDDSGVSRMVELTDHKGNEKEYLKKAYNVEVSDEWMDRYNKLLDTIKKDYKVFYFETKFMRPYGLDEFEKAIVPNDTPSDVVDALKKAGIDVSSYERGNAEDRQKVTMDAINSSDNIRFSLAGERGAAAADKAEERTFRMDNLSVARKMEEKKKDAKAIKMATGWERGADGKWRYEMPDAKIKDTMDVGGGHIVKRYEDDMLWNGGKLSNVIDAPELFKAYPQLKDVRIDTDAIMNDMPSNGEYNSKTNTITIHADELKYMNGILNHEIQHVIQDIEGFAKGGSPRLVRGEVKKRFDEVTKQIKQLRAEGKEDEAKTLIEKNRGLYNAYQKNDDFNSYKSLAGEVEARNVSARLNMTPEERRKSLAESTEDVARKDQIFLGVGDVSFSLRDMADGKESGAADMAEDLKSLNTPDEVDDAIKTAIDDMPSGWKMANKKMIHIAQALGENRKAEIAGEEPKFSLKDGSLIKAGTYFSGGGLVEEGLKGIIDPVVAVEYDEKISGVYRNNFGQHIVTADVRDVDPKELVKQIDGEVEYFHASPVCKNYSQAKSNHAEVELDKETAASTAEFINAIKPKVVTIENVKGYKDSDAMKIITDALDANGYTWDADVYNAADYGGYTNRERLIVRAVREGKLPEKPKKIAHKSGWYEAVADIIPTLTEKKNGVAPWMDVRLKADGIDWRNIDKPLYVMGSAYADGKIPHAFADELLPTLRTKSGDVIVMPDGKVYRSMGRVLARVSGVSDDYKMPFSENLSHTIIGNGIPTQLTEHVIAPLLQNTLRPTTPDEGNTKFSLRYDQFEHDLNQWKKDNNLPKDAQRPTIPQRNAGESAVDFLRRVDEYRKQMALWKTAPTYEQHLLSDDTALGEFNRELQRGSVLKRIAFQDSMLAIRKAQEAIMKEVGVDRLNMAEDAYTAENRSHGKGKNEFEEYNNEFLQPLRKAYHQMKKILGDSYDNVRIYMMAKHGLERDAQMAFKKSLDADFKDVAQRSAAYRAYKGDMNRITNDSDLEFGRVDFNTWRQRDNALRTKYSPSYMDYRYDENGIAYDYSGLSALFGGSDFEEAAHKLVRDIESSHVAEVQDLWNATNAATKKILRDGYKAGMMSKDTYQYVRDMYSHYIPLRGWDGTTADQVWDYVGGGKGAFNQTLKTAHGRTSIADDPIAYIENMAESGILLNNKNWVKQHLMLLAQNHPTSLLTLSKAWYVKSTDANGNEEWIPATPQITSQMNSNQVKAAIDAFEQKMENMAQTGDATQQREGLNIAYPQTHSEEREHEVRVMKDGEEYVIYVNGDPQLAQAMNNTRAHRVSEGIKNSISKRVIAVVGRKMAAAYTSLSPLFIPSNYFRDLTMTLASTAIREDAKYNYLLRKNLTTSWNLGFMLRDFQNGKLRDKVNNGNATPKEQMFYDFMMNGGETGFVSSLDVEDLKKKFKNDLKDLDKWKANPVKVGHTIMDCIEFLNRMIEDSNRFAVYMTSIQYGRSIDEAVNDAKDVTLNFNRKGTGEHSWKTIRNLYLFINPAVQSLQTLGALAKHHPFKFTAVTASWIASGVLVPIVNAALMQMAAAFLGGDGDDDKDWYKDISKKYWQFSKWDRRNNFIMWVPTTHEFVKIPLAQEFRAFYGLGDMIASKMMGGELAEESWEDYGWDLVGQVVDMLPLDPTGYDGELGVSLMPNPIRPVFELAFNVDFTGKPLFKDTEYNKYDPNFTKAYVGTPDWLVRASRMMNSIGNDYPDVQQNKWDALGNPRYNLNNPAVVDHVLSSYLGGAYTMGSQVLGLLTKSLNDRKEIKMADIPVLSKFVSNPDDRPVSKKQGDEFWDKKEYYDRAANTISKLKKQAKIDGDYSLLERFYGSEEYKKYKLYEKDVNEYKEARKKERAEESGDEYRPHQLNAEDIYKNHATPMDEFEDMKLKQLFEKLNSFKTRYDAIVDNAPNESDAYYNTNKAAIDAIDEISLDKQEISELKKGFLDDGKDAYNAEDMKQIRELRKKILAVLEKANKVVVANQKAKAGK